MPLTPPIEKHLAGSDTIGDIVIGLTVAAQSWVTWTSSKRGKNKDAIVSKD